MPFPYIFCPHPVDAGTIGPGGCDRASIAFITGAQVSIGSFLIEFFNENIIFKIVRIAVIIYQGLISFVVGWEIDFCDASETIRQPFSSGTFFIIVLDHRTIQRITAMGAGQGLVTDLQLTFRTLDQCYVSFLLYLLRRRTFLGIKNTPVQKIYLKPFGVGSTGRFLLLIGIFCERLQFKFFHNFFC